jgi:hypothetical protein
VAGGAYLEEVGGWGCALEGYILSLASSCYFCFLLLLRSATLLHTSFYQHVLPHLRPTAMDPVDLGLKPLKLWSKTNTSSLNLFSQVSCHSDEEPE